MKIAPVVPRQRPVGPAGTGPGLKANHHPCIFERVAEDSCGLQRTRMQGEASGLTLDTEIAGGFRAGEQTVLQGRGWVDGDPKEGRATMRLLWC